VQKNSDIKGTTYEERVANNIEFQDWISKWQLAAAYTVLPTIVVVSPDVTTWEPYGTTGPLINNLASVVMK